MSQIAQQALGKWRGILASEGIAENFLTGKHGPCPMCGGKDRFRFDNKDNRGTWYCTNCGAGDGFKFLEKYRNLDFKAAARLVQEKIGSIPVTDSVKPMAQRTPEENRRSLRSLWMQGSSVSEGDFVDKYLTERGIFMRSKSLKKINQCYCSDGKMYPAMLAAVLDAEGNPATIHRTYLTRDGKKAALNDPREFMPGKIPEGAAVRLCKADVNLGIAEGIETAFSAMQLYKIPVWAALNARLLMRWKPPEISKNIFIFGDNDGNYTGQAAAYTLAHNLAKDGLSVTVLLPDYTGKDWNDILMEQQAQKEFA